MNLGAASAASQKNRRGQMDRKVIATGLIAGLVGLACTIIFH
jgi:hypothetical protein